MISKSDIQKLQDLPIEQVAEALGMTVSRHKTLCPFHKDSVPSLTFHRARNRFRCFVCDESGSTIDLVREMSNLGFRDACHWLARTFGVSIADSLDLRYSSLDMQHIIPRKILAAKKPPTDQPIDVHHLSMLMSHPILIAPAEHFLFQERKLSQSVVTSLGISSISKPVPMSGHPLGGWFNAPSLLFPYRDIDGNILSVQARYLGKGAGKSSARETAQGNPSPSSLNPPPRFQFPKGSTCHIFNLPVLKTLTEGDDLFVSEGVSDLLAMMSDGHKAISIPSATLLKEEDLMPYVPLLSKVNIHMFPDDDEPGQRLFVQFRELFPNVIHHPLPLGCKDYAESYVKRQVSSQNEL